MLYSCIQYPSLTMWNGCLVFCLCRNSPKIIEALSIDGASGQHIESSSFDPSSGKKGQKKNLHFLSILRVLYISISRLRCCREKLGVTFREICGCSWWNCKLLSFLLPKNICPNGTSVVLLHLLKMLASVKDWKAYRCFNDYHQCSWTLGVYICFKDQWWSI